jgi:hypothetical protein
MVVVMVMIIIVMGGRWLACSPNTLIWIIPIQQPEPSGIEAGESLHSLIQVNTQSFTRKGYNSSLTKVRNCTIFRTPISHKIIVRLQILVMNVINIIFLNHQKKNKGT